VFSGLLLHHMFIGDGRAAFWQDAIFNGPNNHIFAKMEEIPSLVGQLPTLVGLGGIALAFWFYINNPLLPVRLAAAFPQAYQFLLNKWYFDELYDAIFVKPALWLGREFWQVGDVTLIDGVPNGLADIAVDGSRAASRAQTGSIAIYAFTMLAGLVGLVSLFLYAR
jgi:NADH-quinone oxidoreductase subunit L